MGNLSCVSCSKIKEKKGHSLSVNQLGLGDYKGATFSHEVLDIGESKSSLEHVRLHLDVDDDIRDISSSHLHKVSSSDMQSADYESAKDGQTSRISAMDLYKVIKSSKRHKLDELGEEEDEEEEEMESEEDELLDDVEKAARAIVDMSLFLTTKIIYPAYMRYLEEDHPDEFMQYFARPESPIPASDEQDAMSYDEDFYEGGDTRRIDKDNPLAVR